MRRLASTAALLLALFLYPSFAHGESISVQPEMQDPNGYVELNGSLIESAEARARLTANGSNMTKQIRRKTSSTPILRSLVQILMLPWFPMPPQMTHLWVFKCKPVSVWTVGCVCGAIRSSRLWLLFLKKDGRRAMSWKSRRSTVIGMPSRRVRLSVRLTARFCSQIHPSCLSKRVGKSGVWARRGPIYVVGLVKYLMKLIDRLSRLAAPMLEESMESISSRPPLRSLI